MRGNCQICGLKNYKIFGTIMYFCEDLKVADWKPEQVKGTERNPNFCSRKCRRAFLFSKRWREDAIKIADYFKNQKRERYKHG